MRDLEPTIRSRELGLALHRAAQAKGMRAADIARRLGWSNSKISRLYSGKRGSDNCEDVSAMLAVCDIIGPKRDELMELARHAYEVGWWQDYGGCLPPEMRTLSDYEDAAIVVTNFECTLVPGLLQTAGYTRALLGKEPTVPADEIEERIGARIERQRILDRRYPSRFVFFIDEYVLLRTGPGEEAMSEQVHHLLRMAIRPFIEIRIIPDAAGFHAGQKPFKLMEFTEFHPVVFIENQTSALFLERPDTVAGYHQIAADLDTVALDERHSREWLATLANELGEPREEHDGHGPPLEEEFPHGFG